MLSDALFAQQQQAERRLKIVISRGAAMGPDLANAARDFLASLLPDTILVLWEAKDFGRILRLGVFEKCEIDVAELSLGGANWRLLDQQFFRRGQRRVTAQTLRQFATQVLERAHVDSRREQVNCDAV